MNPAGSAMDQPRTKTTAATLSWLVRRVHMFSALFLAPWMVMYALSTLVMTHREWVSSLYTSKSPAMVAERELDYSHSFPTSLTREEIGQQILEDLGLDGTHDVRGGRNGEPLVIYRQRQHAPGVRRITFNPAKGKVVIERQEFRTPALLERLHRRRGYNTYAAQNAWGFAVDVAVVPMVFWSLSGAWLWWELKSTRRWGALSFMVGVGLFTLFLVLI